MTKTTTTKTIWAGAFYRIYTYSYLPILHTRISISITYIYLVAWSLNQEELMTLWLSSQAINCLTTLKLHSILYF